MTTYHLVARYRVNLWFGVSIPRRLAAWSAAFYAQVDAVSDALSTTLRQRSTEPMQLFLGCLALLWGLFLFLPAETFGNSTFWAMEQAAQAVLHWTKMTGLISPENLWALVLFCVGLSQLRGWLTGQANWRRGGALVAALVWTFMGTCFARVDARLPGTLIYSLYSIFSLWVYWRSRG